MSHGYVVVALDQPGVAAAVVFPGGHQAAGLTLAQFQPVVRPSYMPEMRHLPLGGLPQPGGKAPADNSIVPYLAKDVAFALDLLATLNQADPAGILAGKLDLQRVGAFGISLGGIVVGDACRVDPRLRACLMMDAPVPIGVVRAGLKQPGMWLTRDAASVRLERQRAGGWPEALAQVLGLGGPINGRRAHNILNAYSLAFFDRELRGRACGLLDGPSVQYPEVTFDARQR